MASLFAPGNGRAEWLNEDNEAERVEYLRSLNIVLTVMSEISHANLHISKETSDIVSLIAESHNSFNRSGDVNDLSIVHDIIISLKNSLEAGRFDHFFGDTHDKKMLEGNMQGALLALELSSISLIDKIDEAILRQKAVAVPSELPAPLRVSISDNKITLVNRQTHTGSINYHSANKIRESLHETLADAVAVLPSSSNADQRYVRACSRLLDYISQPLEDVSIEALGLNYQLVSKLTSHLAMELGGSIFEEIGHTLTGIGVLLNQFEEWQAYLSELAIIQINGADSDKLVQQAIVLADQIEHHPSFVDTKVHQRLREMIEPALSGLVNSDTIAAPLIGSLRDLYTCVTRPCGAWR